MDLHGIADATVIATALYAVFEYLRHRRRVRRKRQKLENYLRDAKAKDQLAGNKGQHSIYHLVRHCELTQDEIIQACFESEHVACRTKPGADGSHLARDLLFEYVETKTASSED
jgi:hypothetical protein